MDKDTILSCLRGVRSLSPYLNDSPDLLFKEIESIVPSRYMVYPCDVVDLRTVFLNEKIVSSNPVILFSTKFADKYLKEYSLFLVIDSERTGVEHYKFGGIQFNFCEEMDITKNITRIIINEPSANGAFDKVQGMVSEFGVGVECLVSNSVPGISAPNRRLSHVFEPKGG